MAKVKRYEDLVVWQKAYELVLQIYTRTKMFPADERFGLTQQMRRAAVSVVSNIAEGFGRRTTADFLRFLDMSRGSVNELETQTRIAIGLKYIEPDEQLRQLIGDVERLLAGLIRSLERKQQNSGH
ncbi:four helix bundle protein [Phycisphaeraceae bacterium D3-23]